MTTELSKIYDDFAKIYDANRELFDISEILQNFSDTLLDGGLLLDLGCGVGEPVARYFIDNGWKVIGIDFSEKMIELSHIYTRDESNLCGYEASRV